MKLERSALGFPIIVEIQKLDEGWDVSILGGCKTHIGAVTLANPDGTEQTIERPHHKDSYITRPWAVRLAQAWGVPVCVRCGIHYNNAAPEQVQTIVATCDELLDTVILQMTEKEFVKSNSSPKVYI